MWKQEINRKLKTKRPVVGGTSARRPTAAAESIYSIPAVFENKAGRYELIRVDGGQAYYTFTNRQSKTTDATMPVITWRKMQERAAAAYEETA